MAHNMEAEKGKVWENRRGKKRTRRQKEPAQLQSSRLVWQSLIIGHIYHVTQ